MREYCAYILAGGASSRFGSDKARALIEGKPLIVRIATRLRACVESVTVIADKADKYADLGLPTITDLIPGKGPLGGLHAALSHLPDDRDWALLVSCDFVGLRSAWIDALAAARTPEAAAVAFKPERWQPLLALYHRRTLPEVEARLQRGELAMWQLLEAVDAVCPPTPADWPRTVQINTPEDFERVRSDLPG